MMRRAVLAAGVAFSFVLAVCAASDVTLVPGKTEVVIPRSAIPVVRFAAMEATNYLSQVLSAPVPLVQAPTPGFASLILGTNEWTRAAGLTTDGFKRDEFALVADGEANRIYAYGIDDVEKDPALGNVYLLNFFERATLFAVYDLLEVAAGVRFYFPGEIGTVVPKRDRVSLPRGTRRIAPYFTCRDQSVNSTVAPWFGTEKIADPKERLAYNRRMDMTSWLHLRCGTMRIPFCHGQNDFKLIERFGSQHPEYSQLQRDGKRNKDVRYDAEWMRNQICHSSGVWNEIYLDAISYLKGEDASARGVLSRWDSRTFGWNPAFAFRRYVDVMPQDGMQRCYCKRCQTAYDYGDSNGNYATSLIWGKVAQLANRIKESGLDGKVCMMAYPPYRSVPKVAIPDNVCVEVAETGPWNAYNPRAMLRELEEVKAWSKKVGGKVWMWTYPHKYPAPYDPCVPCFAARAWMKYFEAVGPYIHGSYTEAETDRAIYQYLNFYVYSRLAWDANAEVEDILAEHHRLMFGKGAEAMEKFYDRLETKWTYEVVGTVLDSPLGPVAKKPSDYEMATRVYSPEVLKELKGYLREAATAAKGDAMSTKRIGFMYTEIFKPLQKRFADYLERIDVQKALARRRARPPKNILEDKHWSAWPSASAFDTTAFVTAPNAIHAVCDETVDAKDPRRYICQTFKGERRALVKPNTRYRISFFLKLKNVVPVSRDGGVYFEFHVGKSDGPFYPTGARFTGDMDWSYHEFEITTPAQLCAEPIMCLRIAGAFGEAWYDDVVIEEVDT